MTAIEALLRVLCEAQVQFIVVGGVAAITHGAAYVTNDIDICYARNASNYSALVKALKHLRPRLRLHDGETVPFLFDERTLNNGLNFTLETTLGPIDLLGELAGVGMYADLAQQAVTMQLFDDHCQVMALDDLIRAKRAAGRTKDLLLLQELEALRRMKGKKR